MLNHLEFKVAITRHGIPQWKVAEKLGYSQAAFSEYLRGVRPAPENFQAQVESALELQQGTLTALPPLKAKRAKAAGAR